MSGKEDEYLYGSCADEQDQSFFSSLYEQEDGCPECGCGPLVLRSRGYVCPNRSCRLLVLPNE